MKQYLASLKWYLDAVMLLIAQVSVVALASTLPAELHGWHYWTIAPLLWIALFYWTVKCLAFVVKPIRKVIADWRVLFRGEGEMFED